jgi:hypothetical protein
MKRVRSPEEIESLSVNSVYSCSNRAKARLPCDEGTP